MGRFERSYDGMGHSIAHELRNEVVEELISRLVGASHSSAAKKTPFENRMLGSRCPILNGHPHPKAGTLCEASNLRCRMLPSEDRCMSRGKFVEAGRSPPKNRRDDQ